MAYVEFLKQVAESQTKTGTTFEEKYQYATKGPETWTDVVEKELETFEVLLDECSKLKPWETAPAPERHTEGYQPISADLAVKLLRVAAYERINNLDENSPAHEIWTRKLSKD